MGVRVDTNILIGLYVTKARENLNWKKLIQNSHLGQKDQSIPQDKLRVLAIHKDELELNGFVLAEFCDKIVREIAHTQSTEYPNLTAEMTLKNQFLAEDLFSFIDISKAPATLNLDGWLFTIRGADDPFKNTLRLQKRMPLRKTKVRRSGTFEEIMKPISWVDCSLVAQLGDHQVVSLDGDITDLKKEFELMRIRNQVGNT